MNSPAPVFNFKIWRPQGCSYTPEEVQENNNLDGWQVIPTDIQMT